MDNRSVCPICRTPNAGRSGAGGTTVEYHCPRCGRYQIQSLAETQLCNSRPAFPPMHILSGLCRNTWDLLGERLLVTVDLFSSWDALDKAAQIAVPRDTDPAAKGLYLMRHIRRKTRVFSEAFSFSPADLAAGFCASKRELQFCLRYLAAKGWIEEAQPQPSRKGQPPVSGGLTYFLTPAGWEMLERPEGGGRPPEQAAAAVSFAEDDGGRMWEQGFSAGLQTAGYRAARVDARLQSGKISDEILVAIRRAKLLVADLTGSVPLSLFEAGFALGLGLPVFWTCEETAARDKRLPLDPRRQTLITWNRDDPAAFAARLALRVEAGIGRP